MHAGTLYQTTQLLSRTSPCEGYRGSTSEARASNNRFAKRIHAVAERSGVAPPTPAATPREASASAPSATATAAPPITELITAIALENAKKGIRPPVGNEVLASTPALSSCAERRNRSARSPAISL